MMTKFQKQVVPRALAVIMFQMIASLSWIVSVFIYLDGARWGAGDVFQLAAAVAWTVSNVLAMPDAFERISAPSTDTEGKEMHTHNATP